MNYSNELSGLRGQSWYPAQQQVGLVVDEIFASW
jgi:hypothetical protein